MRKSCTSQGQCRSWKVETTGPNREEYETLSRACNCQGMGSKVSDLYVHTCYSTVVRASGPALQLCKASVCDLLTVKRCRDHQKSHILRPVRSRLAAKSIAGSKESRQASQVALGHWHPPPILICFILQRSMGDAREQSLHMVRLVQRQGRLFLGHNLTRRVAAMGKVKHELAARPGEACEDAQCTTAMHLSGAN